MNDEIKEILDILKDSQYIPSDDNRTYKLLDKDDTRRLLDYITNLQQENEYLKKQDDEKTKICIADHKYASQMEGKVIMLQQENEGLKKQYDLVCKISEERKNKWLSLNDENEDLFYIAKDYKSRCEKINEILKESPDFNYSNDYIILKRKIESVLQNGSDDNGNN